MENEAGGGEISELKQVEGEASCSSCKGKLIFFYEWNISLSWKGKGGGMVGGVQGTARGLGQPWGRAGSGIIHSVGIFRTPDTGLALTGP